MSEQYSINIPAHPNIYQNRTTDRKLRIEFSVPQSGVNKNTGLLIFVPGFEGNIDSKVYKKMRETFADKYNLVTIQCDYFGSCYMQEAKNITVKRPDLLRFFTKGELAEIDKDYSVLFKLLKEKNVIFPVQASINESLEEFNDMSYMQAIDLITAIEAVRIVLNSNNLVFDSSRIIGYGHSHGAYLLHLSNVLAPSLFSYIIDNSAWVVPAYLIGNRCLIQKIGSAKLAVEFDYLAKKAIKNKIDLHLNVLYRNYLGNTQILSFQGNDDNLVNHKDKRSIIESVGNSRFILVTEENIDNKKFKSNTHGLDADFFEVFSYALELEVPTKNVKEISTKYELDFSGVHIEVDYTNGLPAFAFLFKL